MFPHSEGMSARFAVTFTHWAQSRGAKVKQRVTAMKRIGAELDMGRSLVGGGLPSNHLLTFVESIAIQRCGRDRRFAAQEKPGLVGHENPEAVRPSIIQNLEP